MPFSLTPLEIPDVVLIEPVCHEDPRGFFIETYKLSELSDKGIPKAFVQDNHTRSVQSVLRGLHYQKHPRAQGKMVRVLLGEIFDVAVDIRKGSPTYGRWVGRILSSTNKFMLYIPVGFAHGFCVLSDVAEVLYKATHEYSPQDDTGIIWNDPDIAISWPIRHPILSKKDAAFPRLKEIVTGFKLEKSS